MSAQFSSFIFNLRYKNVGKVIKRVVRENLSYNDMSRLRALAEVAINNEKDRIRGDLIEAGCALGGSAIVLAASKSRERRLFIYDVFGVHPPPSDADGPDAHQRYELISAGRSPGIKNQLYYGYERNLYDKVLRLFENYGLEPKNNNVFLRKGLYEDTLKVDSPVSLAHIDCDWYDSVFTCLDRIEPHVVPGGTIIVQEDWPSSKKAVAKYFEDKKKNAYLIVEKNGLHIVKR